MTESKASADRPRRYLVEVADNFHPYSEDDYYTAGRYATLDEAIAACERLVMESLAHCCKEIRELTAEALLDQYKSFGEDPFILDTVTSGVTDENMVPLFSAWKFAERMAPTVVQMMAAQLRPE